MTLIPASAGVHAAAKLAHFPPRPRPRRLFSALFSRFGDNTARKRYHVTTMSPRRRRLSRSLATLSVLAVSCQEAPRPDGWSESEVVSELPATDYLAVVSVTLVRATALASVVTLAMIALILSSFPK